MGGLKGVFDTNILIDYLNGLAQAAAEIARYHDKIISRVTWMEVLVGIKAHEEPPVRAFLGTFRIVELTPPIAEEAIRLRRNVGKIKLPDAIIYATAKSEACTLITRNTRDFDPAAADVLSPYTI